MLVALMAPTIPTAMAASLLGTSQLPDNIDYRKSSSIRVFIDGKQTIFDVDPQIVDGRTLVPFRAIFEMLGLAVNWDSASQTAKGTSAENAISFVIGSNRAIVNNQEKSLDTPASVINGRTMIPLRFLSESLGYNVVWVGSSNLILISKSGIVEWRFEGHESSAPYKEYEVKYLDGVKTTETRYTGTNWMPVGTKTVHYAWEYPMGVYDWTYSLEIPVAAYEMYKSIDRDEIYGYAAYVSEESDDEYLAALTKVFVNTAEENDFDELDTVYLIISFVQHLDYLSDADTTGYDDYPKFPLETLYDKGGDCEDTSILLASLLKELGYGAVLIQFDDHMAVGIKGEDSLPGYYFESYGVKYYYIETTATGWEIGEMPEDYQDQKAQILHF